MGSFLLTSSSATHFRLCDAKMTPNSVYRHFKRVHGVKRVCKDDHYDDHTDSFASALPYSGPPDIVSWLVRMESELLAGLRRCYPAAYLERCAAGEDPEALRSELFPHLQVPSRSPFPSHLAPIPKGTRGQEAAGEEAADESQADESQAEEELEAQEAADQVPASLEIEEEEEEEKEPEPPIVDS